MATFDDGTRFTSVVDFPPAGTTGFIEVEFSIRNTALDPSAFPPVTPLEIANAISAVAEAKGFPKVVFRGQQASATLNP